MQDLLPSTVFGLPLHALLVHATVVLVPLTATLVLACAVVPRIRSWAGWLPVVMAAGCVVLAPLSTASGTNLKAGLHVSPGTPLYDLVNKHQSLGKNLIWFVLAMFAVTAAAYSLQRSRRELSRGADVTMAVAGVVVSLATIVMITLIGHSGAKAVWNGVVSSAPPLSDTR
jgi:uncharacterized membrane protein